VQPPETDVATPEISVVVVNYNAGHHLAACLASLRAQTFTNFEVILVDNASTDASMQGVEDETGWLTVLRQTRNLGFAAGNNVGAKAARGRLLALLNPDAIAEPDWLEQVLAAEAAHPDCRMIACLQVMTGDPLRMDGAGDCYLAYGFAWRGGFGHWLANAPAAGECFAPCGAAAVYPRDLFLKLGGFAETYFCYHEDVDLGFRMRLAGESCQFAPLAKVRHAGSAITGRTSRFSIFHGVRNGVWTYMRNMPLALLLPTLPVWVLGSLALLARGALIGRFEPTLSGLAAGLAALPRVMGERAAIARTRTASLSEVSSAFSWNPLDFLGRVPRVRHFHTGEGPVAAYRPGADP
jgi:N-acetylglucosaminyl-diphospho-decaprenol L-rhamnosyltransferase